jgi:hypothetical protein
MSTKAKKSTAAQGTQAEALVRALAQADRLHRLHLEVRYAVDEIGNGHEWLHVQDDIGVEEWVERVAEAYDRFESNALLAA